MAFLYWVPESVLVSPERMFLKFACVLIGIGVLLNNYRETSHISELPDLIVYELGLSFIIGGVCSIIGIAYQKRSLERLGLLATAFASVSYALMVWVVVGAVGVTTILIFLGLAGAAATRLIVSSVAVRMIEQAAKDLE